jgi:tetratricopeptide (TPR) repeat protein
MDDNLNLDYDSLRNMTHDGNDPEVAFNRGGFAAKNEDFVGAIKDYSAAISYKPDFKDAYLQRAKCFTRIKRYDDATKDYMTFEELGGEKDIVKSKMGNVNRESGDLQLAVQYQNEAVLLNPSRAENYFDRALTMKESGEVENAMLDFEKALQIDPHNTEFLHQFSVFLMGIKDYGGANKIFDKMVEMSPDNGHNYYNRALSLHFLKKFRKSKKDFLKAESLGVQQATEILNKHFRR